ncbi:MAG: restriction endonuclease [Candidatus Woesearchaeota archaeon]
MKSQKNINGYKLERFVEELYKDLGYINVKRNIIFKKGNSKYQIDLCYLKFDNNIPKKIFVEIKYKDNNRKVELEEIAKFYSVLELTGNDPKNSEFITNSYFTERAKEYARRKGIKIIDGACLNELVMKARDNNTMQKTIATYYKIKSFFSNLKQGKILNAIEALSTPSYKGNLDEQIKSVVL